MGCAYPLFSFANIRNQAQIDHRAAVDAGSGLLSGSAIASMGIF
jgi:hypothetical protein